MRRTTREEDAAFLKGAGVWFLVGVAVLQVLIICINVSRQERGLPYWPADVGERVLWTLGMGLWASGWYAGGAVLNRPGNSGIGDALGRRSLTMMIYLCGWLLIIPMVVRRVVRLCKKT